MKGRILIVEDDETFRSFLQTVLEDDGHEVKSAANGFEGLRFLRRENFDLVISDMKMPGKSGLELFRETRNDLDPPRFIFLTAYGRVEEAVAAMKEGAVDFLTKPLDDPETLLALVHRVIENQSRTRDYLSLKESETAGLPPDDLVFAGRAMEEVRKLVYNVSKTDANVLIYGESGTGKELVARSIHLLSPRRGSGFIALNCAAVPENLMESELFGHEKGAFTGAVQARQGKFELARGGTIFLDEIGEMPMALQAKLLRVLQERTFERVGGSREIKADVRVIAATNRNLQQEVADRQFREDLYYRLNVFPILLPPLRERTDAIPSLADYFINRFNGKIGKNVKDIEESAKEIMMDYQWPGNIRELQNVIERAVILAADVISQDMLPADLRHGKEKVNLQGREIIKSTEREIIRKALDMHGGNRRLTATELGISRRSLQYKLKEYGLLDEK
jgi:two-component system response regulator AtoC